MIQQRAQDGQILRYFIVRNMQIGGNYKNFHHALVTLWGNYKVLGQNIHPCQEYIFAFCGRPFGCLLSPHLPTPTATLIDYNLVKDLGMKITIPEVLLLWKQVLNSRKSSYLCSDYP